MFWVIILSLTGHRPGINTHVKLLLRIFFASCSCQVMWLYMTLIWRSAFFASYSRCSALNYWTTSSSCNPLALLLLHLLICFFVHFLCQDFHYANAVESNLKKTGLFYTNLMHRLQSGQHVSPYILYHTLRHLTFWCGDVLQDEHDTSRDSWEQSCMFFVLFQLIPEINTGKNMNRGCNSVPLNLAATLSIARLKPPCFHRSNDQDQS